MSDSVRAFFLQNPVGQGGVGVRQTGSALWPESPPAILWGQGTPNGDLAPFNQVNKGSLYFAINQTDDTAPVWVKVDEGGDNADWVRLLTENHALIDTSDLAAAAGILVEQLETNALSNIVVLPTQVDISVADSEFVDFHALAALTITEIGLIWQEATEATNPAEGDITIGTTSGGGQIVAATPYGISASIGDYQALSLASGAMAAGTTMFVSHDQAASATGLFKVIFKYDLDS